MKNEYIERTGSSGLILQTSDPDSILKWSLVFNCSEKDLLDVAARVGGSIDAIRLYFTLRDFFKLVK